MSDVIDRINKRLQEIALEVVTLDGEDISAMGDILNHLCDLECDANELGEPAVIDITTALKVYLERLLLKTADDLRPLDEGVECLQSICQRLYAQGGGETDTSGILKKLKFEAPDTVVEQGQVDLKAMEETGVKSSEQGFQEEDNEILEDFIVESSENLSSIETSLMDLEQNPNDIEILNSIFRPFHTIKGVSGFLNLKAINELAHSAENLLDEARNQNVRVEGKIIDIILESVDMLQEMIEGIREVLKTGGTLESSPDITPLKNRIDEIVSHVDQSGGKRVGDILIDKGIITIADLEEGLAKQKEAPHKKIGEILIEEKKIDCQVMVSTLREQKQSNQRHMDLLVKVDTDKLDNLVNLTGELVIAQSMIKQGLGVHSATDHKLYQNLGRLTQITTGLQTTAMSMRMVPIKSTFHKMVRLVRDLAKKSGKEAELTMLGEDTEIDRNVVEGLYDPMVHMIRNAVDHGIESPDARERVGKTRKGRIRLEAYHRGGNIIVEIEDDGQGLDKDRIVEKARSANLINDESKLTDSEIFDLIFHPGFSTAKEVTDISGRGVGMDVVKKAIEKLSGRVEINSRPGHGTTFVISLPLTLAIIDGMVARIGPERYIIPTLAIRESFRPDKSQYSTVEGKGEIIISRKKLLPLVRLDRAFNVKGNSIHPWEGLLVTVEYENEQKCLLFDELLGKEEVVVKSLGESLKKIKGISGGAIMGDGRIGLILDMAGIFEIARCH